MSTHTLYVSTRNAHKLFELRAMLAAIGSFELIPAADAEVPDVDEIGETFLDNAVLKAAAAFKVTGGVCLADDSGLIVTVANYLTPAGTAIQGVGLTPEAGLRGPGLGLLEPPLPSAAQFDDAWDHRVCATK